MPDKPRPADLAALPRTMCVRVRPRSHGVAFSSLPLSVRLAHLVKRHALRRLGDVDGRTVSELLSLEGFGSVSAWELFAVLKDHNHLRAEVVFPPRPLVRPLRAMPKRWPSSTLVIRVRPAARAILLERCVLSNWLRGTFAQEGMTRIGDLDGWSFGKLRLLRRFGRVQSRQLLHLLSSNDLIEPAVPFSFDAPRAQRLAALNAMAPHAAHHALAQGAASKKTLPYVVVGVAKGARSRELGDLLLPTGITKKLRRRGYARLGDLDGVVLGQLRKGKAALVHRELAILHGLLRAEDVLIPKHGVFAVPARWRNVTLEETELPQILRLALAGRGLRTLGDLAQLTPERLGWCFGPVREAALWNLVERLRG